MNAVAARAHRGQSKSLTVLDTTMLAGSGLTFANRGEHELKGVPGTWHLYAAQR